ncbi:MAG: T9SS type A sorting domain-containing protein [Bacteroidia bacterium]|nr:T9SS type A sorting domain-containing protein [Bacteroidia bacterium]
MKVFLAVIMFISFNNILNSQIILTVDDLPKSGDVQVSARIDSLEDLTLSPGNSGANIIWDFSTLHYFVSYLDNSFDSTSWLQSSATPESYSFPLADLAQTTNCYLNHNWQTHVVTLVCYHNYLIKDALGLHLYGTTYPQSHLFQQYRNVFPLIKFGDTSISFSKEVIQNSIDSVYVRFVADTSIADGWGTVITPVGSYDALRVFTSETVFDSLYVNGLGQEIQHQAGNYYYRWFTKDMGYPVFQISKGILEKQQGYQVTHFAKYLRRDVNVPENLITEQQITVVPNPFSIEAKISLGNNVSGKYSIVVYDITSKECLRLTNVNGDELTINKGNLKNGLYYFQLINEKGKVNSGKFIIN